MNHVDFKDRRERCRLIHKMIIKSSAIKEGLSVLSFIREKKENNKDFWEEETTK